MCVHAPALSRKQTGGLMGVAGTFVVADVSGKPMAARCVGRIVPNSGLSRRCPPKSAVRTKCEFPESTPMTAFARPWRTADRPIYCIWCRCSRCYEHGNRPGILIPIAHAVRSAAYSGISSTPVSGSLRDGSDSGRCCTGSERPRHGSGPDFASFLASTRSRP